MTKEKVAKYLVKKYNPIGIILFGSKAHQDVHPATDWDIFVFTDIDPKSVENYGDHLEWEDQLLELSILPTNIDTDFILDTATHPVRDMELLYDSSGGLMEKIIENTQRAYKAGPKPLSEDRRKINHKILTASMRKVESRKDDAGIVFFATSKFFMSAIRYWFESQSKWPLPVYEAIPLIEKEDPALYKHLSSLWGTISAEKKLQHMQKVREILHS